MVKYPKVSWCLCSNPETRGVDGTVPVLRGAQAAALAEPACGNRPSLLACPEDEQADDPQPWAFLAPEFCACRSHSIVRNLFNHAAILYPNQLFLAAWRAAAGGVTH